MYDNSTDRTAEPGGSESTQAYIRRRSNIERDFVIVRNQWVLDFRIVGNALSLYLHLRVHDVDFPITRVQAMKAMRLGKDAFRSAEQRLIEAGYLREMPQERQGGWKVSKMYEVLDPWEKASEGAGKPRYPKAGNPPKENGAVENPWAENPPKDSQPVDKSGFNDAENPPKTMRKIRQLNKKRFKKLDINTSSVKPVNARLAIEKALRLFDGMEKPSTEFFEKITPRLSELTPGLDAEKLADELHRQGVGWGVIAEIDLAVAVRQIQARSGGAAPRYPVKYFAAAIAKRPASFQRSVFRPDPFDCGQGVHEVSHWLDETDVAECRNCGRHITDPEEKKLLIRLSKQYQARQLKGVI